MQVNPQQAWAVGDSATILQWAGFSWNLISPTSVAGSPDLNSIYLVSGNFGLIVGGSPAPGSQGTILQIPQMINPIPEENAAPLVVIIALLATLTLSSQITKKNRKKQ
jgi:hypothetical protein